uniref:Iso_dh domain-containing protein n=1 Tax=Schistocephalus solidus TaxID=70667 RepID=A0A183SGU9_SCHSO
LPVSTWLVILVLLSTHAQLRHGLSPKGSPAARFLKVIAFTVVCQPYFAQTKLFSSVSNKVVSFIPGDGVGPELFMAVKYLFKETGIPVTFEELRFRRALDLYANTVHIRSLDGIKTRHNNVDFVVVRECLEGEYSSMEHESVPGVVESLKIITRLNSERIAKFAFDFAKRNGRKKVTAVHKANIMKLADGLFLDTCYSVSKLYPGIQFDSMIVDNCCMQLVNQPTQFDVMVMPNLYGSIIENVGAGLVGGAGLVPGVLFSHDVAVFQPGTSHTFSQASGRNTANPTAVILAAANLLRHIDLESHGDRLEQALSRVLKAGRVLTEDVGGSSTTTDFTKAVLMEM